MNVSISQPDLAKGLSVVGRAVSSRSTLPVLSNILLDAKNNQLRLSATNREIAINCWMVATIEDEGAITIPARLLSEFINSLPPERIDMELTTRTQTLRLSCARFNANMKGIDAFEFPLIPTYQEENRSAETPVIEGETYTMGVDALARTIESVVFSASQDDSRPTLTGVEVTLGHRSIHMAATDGYRLATRKTACTGIDEGITVIVPAKSLAEVARICAGATGDATIIVASKRNQILFSVAGERHRVDVISELIDARFPDYRATIPKSHNTRAIVDTAALLKATRVALLFARDNSNIIRCMMRPDDAPGYRGTVRLSATSGESGDNVSELDADVNGDEIEIAFNGRYMIDLLGQMDQPQVVIETTSPTRPGLFRPLGDEDYMALTMPMHSPK
jgi:DNA polymerase-3 subunit beta